MSCYRQLSKCLADVLASRLKYTHQLSIDGCFDAIRFQKGQRAENDPSLVSDYGFWAKEDEFKRYLKKLDEAAMLTDPLPKVVY